MDIDLVPIRRYVDADNSCLFTSIAYLMNPSKLSETSKYEYRSIIADYLINYNSWDNIFNNKDEKNKYIEDIQDLNNWGGAIELRLFSDIFKIKIGSIDVQTNRVDIYGETQLYDKIIYLIYNGVHYDPLVMNFSSTSDKDSDITKFSIDDFDILIKFRNLVNQFKDNNDYVDLNNIESLQCETCGDKFKDEIKASDHAKNYDHWNFKQI